MAINASQLVQINPRVTAPESDTFEMNGVLITTSEKLAYDVMRFASAESVGELFGFDSDEYRAAATYFTGYDGSSQKPSTLYIGRHLRQDAAPKLVGSEIVNDFPAFLNEGNGSITATLSVASGSREVNAEGIDFSAMTSYSQVAAKLQDILFGTTDQEDEDWYANEALRAAVAAGTVTYNSADNAFIIASADATPLASIELTGGNLISRLGFSAFEGKAVTFAKASTPAETMAKISAGAQAWVCFTTAWEPTAEESVAFATWASQQGVAVLYVHWTDDLNLFDEAPDAAETAVDALAQADIGATTSVYAHDCVLAAFVMGSIASLNFDAADATVTMAYRKGAGVEVSVSDAQSAQILDGKLVNYYGDYATRNKIFKFFQTGRMYGAYGFIDPYINAIWLNNALQNAILQGFQRNPRVPYNDSGYAIVRGWIMDPVTRARQNGVIDTGLSLSEAQKADIVREAKADITTDLEQLGYYVQILDPPASVRGARQSPTVNLWYTYAGSIQRLVMSSIAIL